MDFDDTPKEAEFRAEARAWLDANAPEGVDLGKVDYKRDLAPFKAWQKKKAEAGWACLSWPKEYGGRGASPIERVIWGQEEGELANLSAPFIIGIGMAGPTIMAHGTDAQRERYLPPIASGEEIWCQLFSEPAAGSDLAGIRSRAVQDGDEWVVNGQKIWTSFAHVSDYAIVVVRTDPELPKHEGLTYFILDMNQPGVEVRPIRQVSGDSDFNEVFLTDARIPDANRLGEVGEGWKVAITTLMNERLSVGAAFPSNFDDALELAGALEDERGPLIEDSAVLDRLADWYVKSSGLKYTGLRMVSALSRGKMPGPEASMTKLVLGRGRQDIASFALDLEDMGGIVTDPEHAPLRASFQKVFFRSIGNRLEGGTDEILLNIIGERVLGLPPDVRVDKGVPFRKVPKGKSAA